MTSVASQHVDRIDAALDTWLARHGDDLVSLRRDIHAHPELSGEEQRTTALVAARLAEAGYEYRRMSAGTGVICDLPDASTARSTRLAIRADLDALAMHDQKDVDYRSTVDGVSHACGHDVHTTIAVGTALFFAEHPELAAHALRFIFQPAEESVPGGALEVLRDGGLDDVDVVLGVHCAPKIDVGTIGLRSGAITSAADMATIRIEGPGGHTARPEMTVDTIALAARVVEQLPHLVSDATPDADVKVVFGAIHAGDAANVIPTTCDLKASIRTPSLEAWEGLEDTVRRSVAQVVADTGAGCHVDYTRGVPPTVNDAGVVAALYGCAEHVVGAGSVVDTEQSWGGDDFAWLTRAVTGAYIRLGVHDPAAAQHLDLHAGHFDVDERAIAIGIRLLVTAASRAL